MPELRFYWLSFCDRDRPTGQQFLGAAVVRVSSIDAEHELANKPDMFNKIEGPWIGAAIRKAWALGCNPGGNVGSYWLDDETAARYPHGQLMTKAEVEALERVH